MRDRSTHMAAIEARGFSGGYALIQNSIPCDQLEAETAVGRGQ